MATLIEITDPADPRLSDYVRLRETTLRHSLESRHGMFIAEGTKVIERALQAGFEPRSLLLAPRWWPGLQALVEPLDVPVFLMDERTAEQVTGFHVHRGALGSFHRRPPRAVEALVAGDAQRLVLVQDIVDHTNVGGSKVTAAYGADNAKKVRSRIAIFEDFVDHTNVGAAFRSAAAFGLDAVLVTPRCADPLYRRAIRVSMGTVFQVPWTRIDEWPSGVQQLKDAGYVVAGMTLADDAITLDELVAQDHPKLALVFGTEGDGLSRRASEAVDFKVKIPMMGGVDSLNVASSSAVAFYATR
ncbi:TrmH family RNA methyltransferase [Propionibacteriaceae bacterium G1746]